MQVVDGLKWTALTEICGLEGRKKETKMKQHHDLRTTSTLPTLNVLLIVITSFVPFVLTDSKDLRFVSYTDFHLMNSTNLFHHSDIDNYQHAVFDNNNNRIIVGARDHLVTFRIDSFEKLQVIPWLADHQQVEMCKILGHPESECHNYIKVLLINGSNLFVCGTSAHKPLCQTRPLTRLEQVIKQESGSGVCPQRPNSNNTYVLSGDPGSLFTGLSVGSHGHQHLILKAFSPYSDLVRTRKSSHWLDDPQFVAMFDVDSYIYIFFREVAVEHIPWGKLIVSRVARICKGDRGGGSFNRNEFKSFIKARLNCSRPGEYPFHYDELQAIHYDQERKVFIGAFTTSPNALPGSAVCQFHLDDINVAFSREFKAYDHTCNCWRGGHTNKQPVCKPENTSTTDEGGHHLYELLDGAAQPTQPTPLIEAPMERFTHIVVMKTAVKLKGQEKVVNLIHLSTLEGEIKRYLILPDQTLTSCLIETIEILPRDSGQSIQFMTFNPVTGLLIVGTNERVYQVSKERCHRFNTKTLCESAQDPYCEWSPRKQECIHSNLPSINSCPVIKNLKRTWYGWSDWSKCSVTCGDGIQMRMLVCLDDLGRLSTSSDLRNALRCSGDNYVIRPCKLKNCEDTSVTTWSTWMSNDPPSSPEEPPEADKKKSRKEKRFRCLCEQDGVNRCSATLQVSERSCKVKGECSSRLKRLTEKKEDHNHNHHQTLRKCTKELVMKNEENSKMKKQLHEMMSHKHHHHHHYHTSHPITMAVTSTAMTPTTTSTLTTTKDSRSAARVFVKSFNPHHEVSKIHLNHKLEQQQQQQQQRQQHVKDNIDNSNYYDNYNSNRLPEFGVHEGFRRADLSVHKPRSVENHLKNSHQNIRYHHFSLPQNIYYQRQRTTTMTTSMTTPAPKCPTSGPNVLPVNYGIFYGYCGCRDLGSFRVCHRCNHI